MYQGIILNPQPSIPPTTPPPVKDKDHEADKKATTRRVVNLVSLLLALWISGLWHPVLHLLYGHWPQAELAVAVYLFFRYLGWIPCVALTLLIVSPIFVSQWVSEWWQKRRWERPVAHA